MNLKAVGAAALSSAALALAAGCGGDNSTELAATVTETAPTTGTTGAEKVVVQSSKGNFSPEAIYRKAAPGVVTILAISDDGANDILGAGGGTAGQGSGFVISKDGEILTNAHVVTTGGRAAGGGPVREAKQVFVEFADRNRVQAEIVGVDPDSDVALVKVEPDGLSLTPVELSDGQGIEVGQPVAAIGSPFGEEQSLSIGVISATDRTIPSLTDFSIDGAVQTDASINPGNSGGPLLDTDGQVIGINQQIESQSGSNAGVGFAVPIAAVRYSLDQLSESGKVEYAFIGVTTQTIYPQLADELGISADSGALISNVVEGSPAEKGGLKGGDADIRFQGQRVKTGGDLIVAIDGKPVNSSSDVARLIANRRPGETLAFEVISDGEHKTADVTLGARPEKGS
ncbi:MAG: S1C family serine protease [Solirubrobacterales bacterium]